MAELVNIFKGGVKLARKADKVIEKRIREILIDYKATLTYELEKAIGVVSGGTTLDPISYARNENGIRLRLRKGMQAWWDSQVKPTEELGEKAYINTRELNLGVFRKLFNVQLIKVPVDDLPNIADPKTAGKFDIATGKLRSEAKSGIPDLEIVVGEGGISAEYEKLLRQQFDAGVDPRNAITTFGAQDVARIEQEMIRGLREGVDNTVIRKRLVKQLAGKGADRETRRKIANKIRTILRTTHENASIASAFQFAIGNPAVRGLVRHTGPRPCIACISLDGRVYRYYQSFRDHVNGQCFVTFELVPPEDLGIDISNLPQPVQKAWKTNLADIKPRRFDFLAASEREQRIIVNNDKLYNIWKKEKLPLSALSRFKNGSWVPETAQNVLEKLPELGGLSYPKIVFPTEALKKKYNPIIDPVDRANERLIFSEKQPTTDPKNGFGKPLYPDSITQDMVDNANPAVRDAVNRVTVGYVSPGTMPYYAYNELARALRINIRKTTGGKVYYVKKK